MTKQLKIGKIDLTNAILLAPMEGITDLPFRLICKQYGADIVYTEFVASEALVRDVPKSFRKIQLDDAERPVAVQIFGNSPERMAEAAYIAQEEGADFVDVNYGCWVKKVVNNNAGSALMKSPELMAEITAACAAKTNIPITIKTRLGWDSENINIYEIAKMQEQAGAQAITVHCRTRQQKITGDADWSHIPKIKSNLKNIPLILNGDISSPQLALGALETQGADSIMIARAAVGNPFLFKMAKELINTSTYSEPSVREKMDCCLAHLKLNIEHKGRQGLLEFRKHYNGYLRGMFSLASARQKLVVSEDFNEIKNILEDYYNFLLKSERLTISTSSVMPAVKCRRD